jgi:RNA polymerase sigma-70 factor (ECF subfamily)
MSRLNLNFKQTLYNSSVTVINFNPGFEMLSLKNNMEQDDAQLVESYIDGDAEALKSLIARYLKSVYNFVYRTSGAPDEAHDITQEIFIKIWKHIKKFDVTQNFKTWLFTIARNTTIDWLRKRKNFVFSELGTEENDYFESSIPDAEPLPDELFQKRELHDLLEHALMQIPFDYKTIILLHHTDDLTFEEIAKVVKKPMNTVKSQYRRGIMALRKQLQDAPK